MVGKKLDEVFSSLKNNLKLYNDSKHPHESQNPKNIDFKSINRKNEIDV